MHVEVVLLKAAFLEDVHNFKSLVISSALCRNYQRTKESRSRELIEVICIEVI